MWECLCGDNRLSFIYFFKEQRQKLLPSGNLSWTRSVGVVYSSSGSWPLIGFVSVSGDQIIIGAIVKFPRFLRRESQIECCAANEYSMFSSSGSGGGGGERVGGP